MRPVVADMADEIDVTPVIADELVEAVVLRVSVLRVLGIAEMPLADDARGVPDGLQLFRKRDLTFLQAPGCSAYVLAGSMTASVPARC